MAKYLVINNANLTIKGISTDVLKGQIVKIADSEDFLTHFINNGTLEKVLDLIITIEPAPVAEIVEPTQPAPVADEVTQDPENIQTLKTTK